MTREWKAGDRAMVEIADAGNSKFKGCVRLKGSAMWINEEAIGPLPPALTPEDAAVLNRADDWSIDPDDWKVARDLKVAIQRRVAARQSPPVPAESARQPESAATETAPQPPAAPAFKVGDRVRVVATGNSYCGKLGTVICVHGPSAVTIKSDRSGKEYFYGVSALALVAPDLSALRDAVVEAAKAWNDGFQWEAVELARMSPGAQQLVHAVRALLAAEAPPAPRDPVEELREAAEAVLDDAAQPPAGWRPHSHWAQQEARVARIRAALAAMKDAQ